MMAICRTMLMKFVKVRNPSVTSAIKITSNSRNKYTPRLAMDEVFSENPGSDQGLVLLHKACRRRIAHVFVFPIPVLLICYHSAQYTLFGKILPVQNLYHGSLVHYPDSVAYLASSISDVDMRIEMPLLERLFISLYISTLPNTSTPRVGSSNMRNFFLALTHLAKTTFC